MAPQHAQEEAVLKGVLRLRDPAERAAYLDEACGRDAQLRAAVEALLKAHEQAGVLEEPALGEQVTLNTTPLSEGPGTSIGRYKLLEQIGEGGMGLVFMAEQTEPVHRRVALKIIKLGLDTKQVVARFEAERQALALMDHPNIARVLDAGSTETGRPYFVMDLVRGVPITDYCDKNKLPTRQRLELFMQICGAVQHAHQKGIIHRDIKPTNVLVTLHDGKPVPKVIDFGVSKATSQRLTEKTLFTGFAQMIGTPAYMSPEQAEMSGLDVDARSDIYSLGVLLYELLTGTTPFDGKRLRSAGYGEIRRIIREEEPPRPSVRLSTLKQTLPAVALCRGTDPGRLNRLVRGDLDWIVMKGLAKDRTRRYETAAALAEDIERHLRHEPVLAGPPGAGYHLRKFLRRNMRMITATVLVAAALLVGFVVAAMGFVQANRRREAELARRRAARIGQIVRQCVTLEGHTDEVRSVAFCPDGRTLASGSFDMTARLWDLQGGRLRAVLVGHDGVVNGLTFTPDGKILITAGLDGTVRLWDAGTGKELAPLRGHAGGVLEWGWGLLRDRRRTRDDGNGAPGTPRRLGAAMLAVAVAPNGKWLVAGAGDGTAKVWDLTTRAQVATLKEHGAQVECVAFSPDGKTLATGSWDKTVRLWDTATWQRRATLEIGHDLRAVTFSPDGRLLAVSTYQPTILVWDVAARNQRAALSAHGTEVWCLAFSPDGRFLASASDDKTVKIWDPATERVLATLMGHEGRVWAVAFAPDGRMLASASRDTTVKLWDISRITR